MPFTLAHPAVVLPLPRLLRRTILLSALVAGSVVPDLWYVLPGFGRDDGHSARGLLRFCLPVGLLLWLYWRLLLARAVTWLLSPQVREHLNPPQASPWRWSDVLTAPLSIVIGAFSHIAWDRLTHDAHGEFLQAPETVHVLGREHAFQTLFQSGSSLLGCFFIMLWILMLLRLDLPKLSWRERLWPGWSKVSFGALLVLVPVIAAFLQKHRMPQFIPRHEALNGVGRLLLAAWFWESISWGLLFAIAKAIHRRTAHSVAAPRNPML
jgi:membrane-bound metal-dependent hydrolase YbcI (DUF457 family)